MGGLPTHPFAALLKLKVSDGLDRWYQRNDGKFHVQNFLLLTRQATRLGQKSRFCGLSLMTETFRVIESCLLYPKMGSRYVRSQRGVRDFPFCLMEKPSEFSKRHS